MRLLLAKGSADPHVVNAKGERLLTVCQPLSAVALYQHVHSSSSSGQSLPSPQLAALFPEIEPRQNESAEAVILQLVGFLEVINEGLQLYPSHAQHLEELRSLVIDYLGKKKLQNRIRPTRQLSFSSLSSEELAALKKRKGKDSANDAEIPENINQQENSKKVKMSKDHQANDEKKKENEDEANEDEQEEVIEEPTIGMIPIGKSV